MAKKKKTKKRGKRRGMGSVSGSDKVKRVLGLLTSVVSANLTHEGLMLLSEQSFMQPSVEAGKDAPKLNFKQIAVDGGLFLAAGAGAVMIKNEYASAALSGVAVASSMFLKEDLIKPALGLGAVEDFLELYKNDGTVLRGDRVNVGSVEEPIKIA